MIESLRFDNEYEIWCLVLRVYSVKSGSLGQIDHKIFGKSWTAFSDITVPQVV